MKTRSRLATVGAAVCLLGTAAHPQDRPPEKPADCAVLEQDLFIDLKVVVKAGCTPSAAQIAKLLDNPVGNFVALTVQYDYVQIAGPRLGDSKSLHKLQLTPTFPISLGSDWNLINRVVLPVYSVPVNERFGDCIGLAPGSITTCPAFPEALADPFHPTVGLSDIAYVGLASPKKVIKREATGAAVIWGVGATAMFPTASDEVLGTGKYSLGPTAVVAYLGPKWTFGVFPQHWWSVAGDDNRADLNLTNVQYFVFYAPPWDPEAQWRIGMSPNITVNWKAKGDETTFPIGIGIGRMTEIGKLPVQVHFEVDYSILHPDDVPGSRWDFRVYITPVIPAFMF